MKVGETKQVEYVWNGEGDIKSVGASCGCTIPSFSNRKLTASFTAQNFPDGINEQVVTKTVWAIVDVNGVEDRQYMTFTATVHK
jgi:hypothetical protein